MLISKESPRELAQVVTFLVSIRKVLSSNFARDIDYPDWGFHDFAESLEATAGNDVTIASFRLLSNISLKDHPIIRRYIGLDLSTDRVIK
jgi:hypothetical protein